MELNLPDSLRGMLERSPNLPTLPVVGAKLIDLAKDPNTELCQISELIQHDPPSPGKYFVFPIRLCISLPPAK